MVKFDLTAQGQGYYKVLVNGQQVSQHVAEREAVERASDELHADPTADVRYIHDYEVTLAPELSMPSPEPEPGPDPMPGPDPQPGPLPPTVGLFGPGSNEPAGLSRIIGSDCTSKDLGLGWTYGNSWHTNVSIVNDAATPSGKAFEVLYETGRLAGFGGAAFINDWGARPKLLYIRTMLRYDANWQQHSSHVTKMFYYGAGAGGQAAEFYPAYRGSNGFQMRDQSGTGMDVIWRKSGVCPAGQWLDFELLHDIGDPGQANGSLRFWINGVEVTGLSLIPMSGPIPTASGQPSDPIWQWLNANEVHGFKGMQWGSYWGGSGDQKQQDDRMWWGGLYVSGQ